MAAGSAVLCADEPGPDSELIEDNVNGLRFSPGDVSQLAEKLDRLLTDGELRDRLATTARQTIENHATVERMVDSLADAILAVRKR